jgi:hypothetical protein
MKTTVFSAVVVALATSAASAQQAVQWRVEDGGNGHWYQRQSQSRTWPAAQAFAESFGGHLATPTSAAENVFVFMTSGGQGNTWLGGRQLPRSCEPDCGWGWVTGEPWDYTQWQTSPLQPDNTQGNESHLAYWGIEGGVGQWNDGNGVDVAAPFTVEWSADCNNDGIVDYGQCRDGSLPDYNLNNVPDCCEAGTPCEVGNYPVQWRAEDGGNGHWYYGERFSTEGLSWSESRTLSMSRGGDLVSLNTLQERLWVYTNVASRVSLWTTTLGPWVGGFQPPGSVEPGGGWTWVDGTSVYPGFYWDGYHPDGNNNCGGPANYMSYWGAYVQGVGDRFADGPNVRRWTCWNIDFGHHPSCVIEWSSDCNNDGIVDYGQILQGQLADVNNNGVPDSCEVEPCPADVTGNDLVDGVDLAAILGAWGTDGQNQYDCDIDNDGVVSGTDLAFVLGGWGPCP